MEAGGRRFGQPPAMSCRGGGMPRPLKFHTQKWRGERLPPHRGALLRASKCLLLILDAPPVVACATTAPSGRGPRLPPNLYNGEKSDALIIPQTPGISISVPQAAHKNFLLAGQSEPGGAFSTYFVTLTWKPVRTSRTSSWSFLSKEPVRFASTMMVASG